MRQPIQGKPHHDEGDDLVNKRPVGHDDGAVIQRLAQRVVPRRAVVPVSGSEHRELFLNVLVDGEQNSERGHEDGADKGLDEVGEDVGDAVQLLAGVAGEQNGKRLWKRGPHIKPKAIWRMLPWKAKSMKPSKKRLTRCRLRPRRDSVSPLTFSTSPGIFYYFLLFRILLPTLL